MISFSAAASGSSDTFVSTSFEPVLLVKYSVSWSDPGAHTESPSGVGDEEMTATSRVGGGGAPADKVVGRSRDHQRWRRLDMRSGSWEERGGAPSSGGDDLSGETIGTVALSGAAHVVPHFCADSVGKKDTPRSLGRGDLSGETVEAPDTVAGNGALQSFGNNFLNETVGTLHQLCADLGVGNVPTRSSGRDDLMGETGGNPVVGNVAPQSFRGDDLLDGTVGTPARFRAGAGGANVGNFAVSGEGIPFSAIV